MDCIEKRGEGAVLETFEDKRRSQSIGPQPGALRWQHLSFAPGVVFFHFTKVPHE